MSTVLLFLISPLSHFQGHQVPLVLEPLRGSRWAHCFLTANPGLRLVAPVKPAAVANLLPSPKLYRQHYFPRSPGFSEPLCTPFDEARGEEVSVLSALSDIFQITLCTTALHCVLIHGLASPASSLVSHSQSLFLALPPEAQLQALVSLQTQSRRAFRSALTHPAPLRGLAA